MRLIFDWASDNWVCSLVAAVVVGGCAVFVVDLVMCLRVRKLPREVSGAVAIMGGLVGAGSALVLGGLAAFGLAMRLVGDRPSMVMGMACVGSAYMAAKALVVRVYVRDRLPREQYGRAAMDLLLWNLLVGGPAAVLACVAMARYLTA